MQRVIHLIEALNRAGIAVPPFPYAEPLPATPGGQPPLSPEDLQIKLDAYEVRVEAWRQQVITLHKLHFP